MVLLDAFGVLDLPDGGQTVDEGLLPKIAAGDQEAFHQLYQSTDRAIYGFILPILIYSFISFAVIFFTERF